MTPQDSQTLTADRDYKWNGVPYGEMSHSELVDALKIATDIGMEARDHIRALTADATLFDALALAYDKWLDEDEEYTDGIFAIAAGTYVKARRAALNQGQG